MSGEGRSDALVSIRLVLDLPVDISEKSEMISFQNNVLRPVLKFQHSAIILYFFSYCKERKTDIGSLSLDEKKVFIKQSLGHDQKLKGYYFGLITALFTEAEYKFYLKHKKEVQKRSTSMLIERVLDGIQ